MQLADDALLVLRQQFGAHLDAELLADGRGGALVVAGQHDRLDAGVASEP